MQVVPLSSAPNQQFTVTLEGIRWGVRLVQAAGVLVADVSQEGVGLVRSSRVLAGEAIIPYAYLQTGNFIMVVNADELPTYSQFGVSQFLVYLSAAEIAALDANPPNVNELTPFMPSYLVDDSGLYLTTDAGELLTDD